VSELFPILAGTLIGLVVQWIAHRRGRMLALTALSIVAGFTASLISGELFVSWDFLFVDIPLVFLTAMTTTLILAGWRRWQILH
jgi:hypothetical protein